MARDVHRPPQNHLGSSVHDVAAALGPQIVGVLIDVNGRNYQMVFAFPAVVMAIAAALFLRSLQPTPLVMPAAKAAPLPE